MINHQKLEIRITWLLIFLFGAGLIFHGVPLLLSVTQYITDIFLFLVNILVLFFVARKNRMISFWIWLTGAYLFTYFIELSGIITGKIFGNYWYGDTLLLQLGKVPLIIPFNWLILILCTHSLARKLTSKHVLVPFLSSTVIVLFDILIEPVAMKLDYWQWEGSIIPIRNYIVWFIISFLLASVIELLKIDTNIRLLRYYIIIQVVFFTVIRFLLIP